MSAGSIQQKKHKFGAGLKNSFLNRKKSADDSDDSSEEEAPKKKKDKKKHESSDSEEEEEKKKKKKEEKKKKKEKEKEKEKEVAQPVDTSSNCMNHSLCLELVFLCSGCGKAFSEEDGYAHLVNVQIQPERELN